jgi:uncharacterized membrane protein
MSEVYARLRTYPFDRYFFFSFSLATVITRLFYFRALQLGDVSKLHLCKLSVPLKYFFHYFSWRIRGIKVILGSLIGRRSLVLLL